MRAGRTVRQAVACLGLLLAFSPPAVALQAPAQRVSLAAFADSIAATTDSGSLRARRQRTPARHSDMPRTMRSTASSSAWWSCASPGWGSNPMPVTPSGHLEAASKRRARLAAGLALARPGGGAALGVGAGGPARARKPRRLGDTGARRAPPAGRPAGGPVRSRPAAVDAGGAHARAAGHLAAHHGGGSAAPGRRRAPCRSGGPARARTGRARGRERRRRRRRLRAVPRGRGKSRARAAGACPHAARGRGSDRRRCDTTRARR